MKRHAILLGSVLVGALFAGSPVAAQGTATAGQSTKTCSFYCVSGNDAPTQAGVIERCNNDSPDCTGKCQVFCQRSGKTCFGLRAAPAETRRPRCVDSAAPAASASQPGNVAQPTGTRPAGSRSGSQGAYELINPLGRGVTSIPQLFGRVVRAFMGILGALAMFWFVWGGILWMTAEESKRSEQAKTIMKNATLGLILIFFSYGLTTMFLNVFQELARNAAPPRATSSPAARPR